MNVNNPKDFPNGTLIESVYTGIRYTVVDNGYVKGMAKLRRENRTDTEEWNAYNNAHFRKLEGQLNFTFK